MNHHSTGSSAVMDTDTVAADPELESISIVNADVVIVEWRDLIAAGQEQEVTDCDDNDCTHKKKKKMKMMQEALERAYGSTGAGILCIRGMPGFVAAKDAFLPMAHALATALAPSYLETHLTDAASLYNAGWSHGKEKLGADKPPDTAKGSFYYNPMTDLPGSAADREAYPLSYPCNVWPDENQILLPDFKKKAVAIGKLLKEACVAVAKQMDTLAATKQPSYTPNLLYNSMKDTDKVKARLLYYFPLVLDEEQQQQQQSTTNNYNPAFADSDTKKNEAVELAEDSWIGWHNDSGFLTALAGDMYVDHATGRQVDCPDPAAGLYVIDRRCSPNTNTTNNGGTSSCPAAAHSSSDDGILRVVVPPDCVAVQVGECTQIVTGGAVQATPHCVRACRLRCDDVDGSASSSSRSCIARISLPCFVDTVPGFCLRMPAGCTREQVLAADCTNKVPPLGARWQGDDMTFGSFLQTTFATYYDWKP